MEVILPWQPNNYKASNKAPAFAEFRALLLCNSMILDSTPSQMNSFLTHSVLLSTATRHCDFHVVL